MPLRQAGWYSGESWSLHANKHLKVSTSRERGTSNETDPEFWTMRLEHSDSRSVFRIWRTDIGLRKLGTKQYQFTIATSHYLQASFMDKELEAPELNVPAIVSLIVKNRCFS